MNKKKRKTRIAHDPDKSNSETAVNYTVDEDFENPFCARPRIEKSPVLTRSRKRQNVRVFENSDTDGTSMINEQETGATGGSAPAPSNTSSLDGIEVMLERVLTVNHNTFMGEMQNLRRSLTETVSANQNSNHNLNISGISHAPHVHRDVFELRGDNNRGSNMEPNLNLSTSSANSGNFSSVRIDKWNITYDGTKDVHDFLFKIDTLRRRYNCTEDEVVANFHLFLKGKADAWFWFYLKKSPNTTYSQLCDAIVRKFLTVEDDCDLFVKMIERHQRSKECFEDYFTDILNMNSRLTDPLRDEKLVNLIMKNAWEPLGNMLFAKGASNLDQLRDRGLITEKFISRQIHTRQQKRTLAEIGPTGVDEMEDDIQADVSAINHRIYPANTRRQIDTSKYKCWNCDQVGHSYYDCPSETRNLFCYRCGEKNVTTIKCKVHLGNITQNEK